LENVITLLTPDQQELKSKLPSFGSSAADAESEEATISKANAYLRMLLSI
jgi:hypothetical protein